MSYFLYGFSFILLMAVELFGRIGMGAQRWINLGFIELQPSELMKISLVLMISDYLHHYHLDINHNSFKTLLVVFFSYPFSHAFGVKTARSWHRIFTCIIRRDSFVYGRIKP